MDEIQRIVARLNQPPFSKNLRLVDFDEKSPAELLQLLNDIFTSMDSTMKGDVRDEEDLVRAARMGNFLQMLKCPLLPQDEDRRTRFTEEFGMGSKNVVYPVFHWALTNYEKLCKRAYLGKYLVRIEPPQEFMQDDTLGDLVERYKELQVEFKGTHQTFDSNKATMSRPGAELRAEIQQLEDERRQLQDRIEKLKSNTRNEIAFPAMLAATSSMRQEQDEEVRLQEKMREQRHLLDIAEQRFQETQRRLSALKGSATGGHSAEAILKELQKDVQETAKVIRGDMAGERNKLADTIARLERQRLEPNRSIEDVERMRAQVRQLERQKDEMRETVEKAMSSRGDNKLGMFRQHANMASAKLMQKEEEVESRLKDLTAVRGEVDELEAKVNDIAAAAGGGMVGPNGRQMTRDEFKEYGAQLREKSHKYKLQKTALAGLRAESVVLHRTEQILKGRDRNLEEFLTQQEAKAGVSGYRDAQSKLEMASEQTAEMDDMKGQTLDEISEIVKKINGQLEEKKTKLKPLIKELKEVRKQYQECEQDYLDKKQRYDSVAVGLATERSMLEGECDELQDECLQEESRYHYLNCLSQIASIGLEKVQQEEKWTAGHGRLLPEFANHQELYQNKINQQESLSKQLRKQQKKIKENEGGNMYQRSLYADLHRLLSAKVKSRLGGTNNGNILGISGQLTADTMDFGTAQVVRID